MASDGYVRYADLEAVLKDTYERTGVYGEFIDALRSLVEAGRTVSHRPAAPSHSDLAPDAFLRCVDESCIPTRFLNDTKGDGEATHPASESSMIPEGFDLFALRHLPHVAQHVHSHGCFDINYVYRGSATLDYEGVLTNLHEGDLCIIAPHSSYRLEKDDVTVIMTVYIRQSVMDTAFFEVLTQFDIVSEFVRDVLYEQRSPNYLLFLGKNTASLREVIQNLFIETNYPDEYSPVASLHWTHLLFVALLRDFDFQSSYRGMDTSNLHLYAALEYTKNHLQDVSLGRLAKMFGYNESYLSSLFTTKIGCSYSDYVTDLRMTKAMDLLENTNEPLERIAAAVGYGSVDHFGRRFKRLFGVTPGAYRRQKRSR